MANDWLTIHGGDCREVLRELPAESVHCVVTSPPYWGLRDYGTATWEGGDADCDHVMSRALKRDNNGGMPPAGEGTRGTQSSTASSVLLFRDACGKCGARRVDAQLGLETTPEAYVAAMVDVFREVRRVLRDDGTLWLNLGDSYAAARSYQVRDNKHTDVGNTMASSVPEGLKPKDLVGIPWRVAFALQADGWYLRSDIVWAKPNPMPESVTDRPTKSHEYVFLLAKSARYFFDADAVRETSSDDFGRNIRSVWTIATAPYPGAHFATFPPKLVEPCVKAGCPVGGVVLDPFAGTGTVGMVAQSLSRRAVLIELNPEYLRQCLARNAQAPLGLGA
jgi:site-specific DNA-methyltransferase (adenine-specific)